MYRDASTPGNLLLVATGGTLVAYDRRSGRVAWRFEAGDHSAAYSGTRCVVEGNRVVTASSLSVESMWSADALAVVTCLDYPTGRVLWQQRVEGKLNSSYFSATLLVDSGQVLFAHGPVLVAYDLESGAMQWSQPIEGRSGGPNSLASALIIPGRSEQADRR